MARRERAGRSCGRRRALARGAGRAARRPAALAEMGAERAGRPLAPTRGRHRAGHLRSTKRCSRREAHALGYNVRVASGTLLLSVDFEDWHQLVRRRLGAADWARPGPALERQTEDAAGAVRRARRARHVLRARDGGARASSARRGDRRARARDRLPRRCRTCPCTRARPSSCASDLRAARATIARCADSAPERLPRARLLDHGVGAAGPTTVLAQEGFAYDSSQHDSPRIRGQDPGPRPRGPHAIALADGASLWEFPLAVWRLAGARLPVGGASYWALLPRSLVLRGLERAGPMAGLYLHPHELDPRAACALGAPARARSARLRARARCASCSETAPAGARAGVLARDSRAPPS